MTHTTDAPVIVRSGWLVALFCLAGIGLPSSLYAAEIAILKSADMAAYNKAVEGFKAAMPDTVAVLEYDMQGDIARGRSLARKLRATDAALVLAVGLKAALAAKLELVDIPVIFCMVLDPARYDLTAPNMTGVLLEVPVELQLTTMRAVLPNLRQIGVAYDPEKTATVVEEARRLMKDLGLELVARPVRSEKEVPAAVRAMLPSIQALWLVPDSTVLTEDSLQFMLGLTLDHNIPVIGFSSEFVRSGALVSLSVSYRDVGHQAGLLAKKILTGQDFSSIAVVPPDKVRLALNLKTAQFLGITIPTDMVNRADEVY